IVIIGAGPAGLSASIYGARAGKSVLLLEAGTYGGQIINTPEVENYPGIKKISGFEFAMNLYEQALNLGAEIEFEKAISIEDAGEAKAVVTEQNKYPCKAVIIATGAKNRPLGVEGEDKLVGSGISYCATCDGAFFRGKDVAVVGGGNTALEDAMFLSEYCSKVYIIHRRDEFRGEEYLHGKLMERGNIEFVLDSVVDSIAGDGSVKGLMIKNRKTEEITEIQVSGVFVAIGQMPDNKDFEQIVKLDAKGYVEATESCKTKTAGVFTAGDCRTKTVRQLATAAADGAVSALAAVEYINLMG
ncbi:MAG TPA: thioredoxin-disulfide reductase, partial [Anaerovoracaceae bacterium]|nr:thioredoxin-disulfide reductase [Anaerovoracaceae bacterium]